MAVIVQDSCALVDFNQRFLVQRLANVVHATVGEDRTPRRTHIFLSLVRVPHMTALSHIHARMSLKAQAHDMIESVAQLRAFLKVIHSQSMFQRPISIILFHATAVDTELTADDRNQETPPVRLNKLLSQISNGADFERASVRSGVSAN